MSYLQGQILGCILGSWLSVLILRPIFGEWHLVSEAIYLTVILVFSIIVPNRIREWKQKRIDR